MLVLGDHGRRGTRQYFSSRICVLVAKNLALAVLVARTWSAKDLAAPALGFFLITLGMVSVCAREGGLVWEVFFFGWRAGTILACVVACGEDLTEAPGDFDVRWKN